MWPILDLHAKVSLVFLTNGNGITYHLQKICPVPFLLYFVHNIIFLPINQD